MNQISTAAIQSTFSVQPALAQDRVEASELELHRSHLTRYALRQLGNREAALDAVQDTMLAALQAPLSFANRSSVRTWLFGILKHKVMDAFRRQARDVPLDGDNEDDLAENGTLFGADSHWGKAAAQWGDPEQTLNQKRFFEVLERCVDRLPSNTARVFKMREIMGLETEEICATVGITPTNCLVIMHRARTALRNALGRDWAPSLH
jgi:RNA polymerase sigma-70 factor (TIGR02943 family)